MVNIFILKVPNFHSLVFNYFVVMERLTYFLKYYFQLKTYFLKPYFQVKPYFQEFYDTIRLSLKSAVYDKGCQIIIDIGVQIL